MGPTSSDSESLPVLRLKLSSLQLGSDRFGLSSRLDGGLSEGIVVTDLFVGQSVQGLNDSVTYDTRVGLFVLTPGWGSSMSGLFGFGGLGIRNPISLSNFRSRVLLVRVSVDWVVHIPVQGSDSWSSDSSGSRFGVVTGVFEGVDSGDSVNVVVMTINVDLFDMSLV